MRNTVYIDYDPDAILQCKDVTKAYFPGGIQIKAVNSVSLRVLPGEFIAICGPSGSGKSSLLYALGRLDRPTTGRVYIDKTNVYELNDKKAAKFINQKVGFIYQNYNLLPVLTAQENILLAGMVYQKTANKRLLNELAEMLQISDRLRHLPSELSGGQQQRVAIARALINRPAIVLADEPTGNLDRKSSDEIMTLLLHTRQKIGAALVMVTHDHSLAAKADRVFKMDDGILTRA